MSSRADHPKYMHHTKEGVIAEAKNYHSRMEYKTKARRFYRAGIRLGIHDLACAHMPTKGNKVLRTVYQLTNKNSVYYGITLDFNERIKAHKQRGKLGGEFKAEMLTGYIPLDSAVAMERQLIASARLNTSLNCANIKNGGESGGTTKLWTDEALKAEAMKYNSLSEFQSSSPSADSLAYKRGVHAEICAHMTSKRKPNGYYKNKPDLIRKAAIDYTDRMEFDKALPGASREATRLGIYSEVCSHMKLKRKKRTKQEVIEGCKKYPTATILIKESPALHSAARRMGVWNEASEHMISQWQYKKSNTGLKTCGSLVERLVA